MKKYFFKFILSLLILLLLSSCIPKMDFFIERIRIFSTNLIEFDFGTTSTQILSHLNENFSEITIEVSSRKDNLRTAELNWEIKNFTENTAGDFTAEGTINELPSNIIYRDGESATRVYNIMCKMKKKSKKT